jgi:MAP7 domain-containing protein 1
LLFQVAHQQKFREQQDFERQKRMTEVRARDSDKHSQVEERRRAIESAERERRESLLRKNQEREDKIIEKRRAQQNQNSFAFGSSTPRMGYGTSKSDSTTDVCRSTSSHNMTLMTQSMYQTSNSQRRSTDREDPPAGMSKGTKRATSVHGLDQSTEEGKIPN